MVLREDDLKKVALLVYSKMPARTVVALEVLNPKATAAVPVPECPAMAALLRYLRTPKVVCLKATAAVPVPGTPAMAMMAA
jgi:NADPH:quinone reductase-like Zn-dependent oxidoreductase